MAACHSALCKTRTLEVFSLQSQETSRTSHSCCVIWTPKGCRSLTPWMWSASVLCSVLSIRLCRLLINHLPQFELKSLFIWDIFGGHRGYIHLVSLCVSLIVVCRSTTCAGTWSSTICVVLIFRVAGVFIIVCRLL